MSVVSGVQGAKATKEAGKDVAGATDKSTQASLDMYNQSRKDQMPWLTAGKGALTDLYGGTTYTGEAPKREDFTSKNLDYKKGGWDKLLSPDFSRETNFDQAGYDQAMADYEATGVTSTGMIQEGPGDFAESEYYQEGLAEEESAINRYLNSRGLYASGKAGKALSANAVSNMNKNRGNWLNEWMQTKLAPLQSLAGVGITTAGNMGREGSNTAATVGQNTIAGARATGDARIAGANILSGASQNTANAIASYYSNKTAAPAFNSPGSSNTGNYGPTQ